MTALLSSMQLEQTQPFCLFGIKYPQVSRFSQYLRALPLPDAKPWKPPHYVTIFFSFPPHWLLSLNLLSLAVFFLPLCIPQTWKKNTPHHHQAQSHEQWRRGSRSNMSRKNMNLTQPEFVWSSGPSWHPNCTKVILNFLRATEPVRNNTCSNNRWM